MTNPCIKESEFASIWKTIRGVENGSGRWPVAFWILVFVCTVALPALVAGAINVDLRSAERDRKLIEAGNINSVGIARHDEAIININKLLEKIDAKLDNLSEKITKEWRSR